MTEQKKTRNIIYCFLIAICYVILIKVIGTILNRMEIRTDISDLLTETINTLIVVIIMFCSHKQNILKGSLTGFAKGLLAGGFLFGYVIIMLVSFFIMDFSISNLQPFIQIVTFILYMGLIGFSEEILFRGVILNTLCGCFGKKSKLEIYKTIALSSFIFGSLHISNVFSGVPFGAALIQAAGAFSAGCYFSAIYMRCGNIWSTVVLHGLMDFVALMDVGLLGNGDMVSSVSAFTPIKLVGVILYLGLAVFLLRDSKMKYRK